MQRAESGLMLRYHLCKRLQAHLNTEAQKLRFQPITQALRRRYSGKIPFPLALRGPGAPAHPPGFHLPRLAWETLTAAHFFRIKGLRVVV